MRTYELKMNIPPLPLRCRAIAVLLHLCLPFLVAMQGVAAEAPKPNGQDTPCPAPDYFSKIPKPDQLPMATGPVKPTWDSIAREFKCPEWFADAKFGIWAHWGGQSMGGSGSWPAKSMYDQGSLDYNYACKEYGHPSKVGYKDVVQQWKAEKFDPDATLAYFKKTGMRYFMALGVHHDNIDNWDSKYHQWNAVKVGPKKDIIGLWQAAAKKLNIPFGISEHLAVSYHWYQSTKSSDKKGPLAGVPYDTNDPEYVELYHPKENVNRGFSIANVPEWWKQEWFARIHDLITRYQPDMIDTDDFGVPFGDLGLKLVSQYYNLKTAANGGKSDGLWTCKMTTGGKGTVEMVEFGMPPMPPRYPWQRAIGLNGWFHRPGATPKSLRWLTAFFSEVISRNGNLLLAVTQYPDGRIVENQIPVLDAFGAWLAKNSEAVYGTRAWRIYGEGPTQIHALKNWTEEASTPEDIRFTRKGGTIYAFCLGKVGTTVMIRSLGTRARLADGNISSVTLLGSDVKLDWKREPEGLKIQLPAEFLGRYDLVFAIRGLDPWDGDIRPLPEDVLTLEANDAQLHGVVLSDREYKGQVWIQNWTNPEEWISWDKANFMKAGTYEVTVDVGADRAGVPLVLSVGDQQLTGNAPKAKWGSYVPVALGTVKIDKAGPQVVSLRAGQKEGWAGIAPFRVLFKPVASPFN